MILLEKDGVTQEITQEELTKYIDSPDYMVEQNEDGSYKVLTRLME